MIAGIPGWYVATSVDGIGIGYFVEIFLKFFLAGFAGFIIWSAIWDYIPRTVFNIDKREGEGEKNGGR